MQEQVEGRRPLETRLGPWSLPCPSQAPQLDHKPGGEAGVVARVPEPVCRGARVLCSGMKGERSPSQQDDMTVRLQSWPQRRTDRCHPGLLQAYGERRAGADHKGRLGGIFAHNTAPVA